MRTNWHKALLVSFVLITSSLAGCLNKEDDDNGELEGQYGTVMVSTYHVGQLVSAITGDTVNVQMISQDNIPVHDYEPSLEDIVRLQDADLFLYHGLGLEPWAESTLEDMGDDAPAYGMTHALPTGEVDLDYESMLITDLCELLTSGPYESLYLSLDGDMNEIHAEPVAHSIVDAEHEEDEHDEHHDEDEHDGHEGHGHAEAEETIANPEGCPTDSVIQIFHLEEGEYVIEFESEHHDEEFDMAVLKMLGGHAHHDHNGHGDEDEHHGECHDTTTHENYESTEEDCEAAGHVWMEEDHGEHGHDEEPTPEEVLEMFDTNNDSSISWDEFWASWEDDGDHDDHEEMHHNLVLVYPDNSSVVLEEEHDMLSENTTASDFTMHLLGMNNISYNITEGSFGNYANSIGGFEAPADYSWWWELHTWNDSAEAWEDSMLGMDSVMMEQAEHIAWAPNSTDDSLIPTPEHDDGHDDHDDHDEDHDEMVCYDISSHTIVASLDNQTDCEAAGMMWVENSSGDSHTEDGYCHNTTTHENYESTEEDCEAAGHVWMEEDDHDDHGHDEDCHNEHSEEEEMSMLMAIFNESDSDSSGMLELSELDTFIDHVVEFDECHEEIDEDIMGYATIHIEVEGEYGFAHSSELEIFLMMAEGGHDDHAGHDDHDDHGDEDGHEEGEHDEDEHDEEGHDEELAFDPHSWLDPLAFKAQVDVVLQHLIDVFPEGEDTFTANAEEFKGALDALHVGFDAALNDGVCTDKTVVANHNAYSYMAYRYDIQFVTVHGIDPEGEPTAEDITEVVEHINEEGITVLFVEEFTDKNSVQSIADETGVSILTLYTMEMSPTDAEDDYISMMQKNLDNMLLGMGC